MTPTSASSVSASRWSTWLGALALAVAAAVAWGRTLSAPLVFDDRAAIVENATIRALSTALSPPVGGSAVAGRLIVNLSFALNYAWGGTEPAGYHATNLVIHVLAGLVLLGLVRRSLPFAAALALALLWTLHPLQTESVTCVAQRTESLAGLFYLLVLSGLARGGVGLGVSVAACWLGVATKETMVTAPLVALLYDRTFLAGSFAGAWKLRRGYYVALAASWLLLAFLVWHGHGTRGTAAGFGQGVSSLDYLLTQGGAILHYLRLAVFPYPLVVDYGPATPGIGAGEIGAGLVVLALVTATIWALVRRPTLGFLGAFFFLVLAPSSSLVPLAAQTIAEHRMYLPLAAVLMLAMLGAQRWLGRAALPTCFVFAGVAAIVTWQRNEVYRSELALWADTVTHAPENARAHLNLGAALMDATRAAEAVREFEIAARLRPNAPEPRANLAHAFLKLGRIDEAVTQGEAAVELAPEFADARSNLGEALYSRGNRRASEHDFSAAIADYRRTLQLVPDYLAARNNLANALLVTGAVDEAIAEYREILRLRPDERSVEENLEQALALKARR